MLELRHVSALRGGLQVLTGIDLTVESGERVALLGPNGAGKTSLLRAISGLEKVIDGSVQWEGRSITGWRPHDVVRAGIAHVPEGRGLFPGLRVRDNLLIGYESVSGSHESGRRRSWTESLEWVVGRLPFLGRVLDLPAGALSGGQQQLLAIACALISEPRLLLLDEPTTGLAPVMVGEIVNLFADLDSEELSLLLVEQHRGLARDLCTRGYVLVHGLVQMTGPTDEIVESTALERAYLGELL